LTTGVRYTAKNSYDRLSPSSMFDPAMGMKYNES